MAPLSTNLLAIATGAAVVVSSIGGLLGVAEAQGGLAAGTCYAGDPTSVRWSQIVPGTKEGYYYECLEKPPYRFGHSLTSVSARLVLASFSSLCCWCWCWC